MVHFHKDTDSERRLVRFSPGQPEVPGSAERAPEREVQPGEAAEQRQSFLQQKLDTFNNSGFMAMAKQVHELFHATPAGVPAPERGQVQQADAERAQESIENMDPYTKMAFLAAQAMRGPMPALRAGLQALVPELQGKYSYGDMLPQMYDLMVKNHKQIVSFAVSQGMSSQEIEAARSQVPNNPQGTLAFIQRAFSFDGSGQSRGVERARQGVDSEKVFRILILVLTLVIKAVEKYAEMQEKKNAENPEQEQKLPGELTLPALLTSNKSAAEVVTLHAQKEKEQAASEKEMKTIDANLSDARTESEKLTKEKDETEDKLKKLQEDPKKNAEDIKKLEDALRDIAKKIETNGKKIVELEKQKAAVQSRIASLEREIEVLKEVIGIDKAVQAINEEVQKLPEDLRKALGDFALDRQGIVLGENKGQMHRLFKKKSGDRVSLRDAKTQITEKLESLTQPADKAAEGEQREDYDGNVWEKQKNGMWHVIEGFVGFRKGSTRNGYLMDTETKRIVPKKKANDEKRQS